MGKGESDDEKTKDPYIESILAKTVVPERIVPKEEKKKLKEKKPKEKKPKEKIPKETGSKKAISILDKDQDFLLIMSLDKYLDGIVYMYLDHD